MMKFLAILVSISLFTCSSSFAEELMPQRDNTYHIKLSPNEVNGLYELIRHRPNYIKSVAHIGKRNKRDAEIKIELKRKHLNPVFSAKESRYTNTWNASYQLQTTMAISRTKRILFNSSGDASFSQRITVDGTTFISNQQIDFTWDSNLKELLVVITFPGYNAKNGIVERGKYNIEATNKFTATAEMNAKEKANAWSLAGGGGFSAQAHAEASHVIQVDVTVSGSPFELRMGNLFMERQSNGRKTIFKLGQDWTSEALLDYTETVQRIESLCGGGWSKSKAAVYTLWGEGGSQSGQYSAYDCLNSKVENLFAKVHWKVSPSYYHEYFNAGNPAPNGVGLAASVQFVIDDLNLKKGEKAKARMSFVYNSKLNWDLDIEGIPESFELGSSQPFNYVHDWPEFKFELE